MKVSARNTLEGIIREVNHGAVNSEVVLALPGGQHIVSIVTRASAEALKLEKGMKALAVIKATSVMIGTEHD